MFRQAVTAAALLLTGSAFAAEIDPGRTPGLLLLLDGLPGSANEASETPTLDIKLRDEAVKLESVKLAEVAARLGGEVHTAGESENAFAWLCYASPDANSGGTTLTWFFGVDAAAQTLSGFAVEFAPDEYPEACTRLDAPLDLTTGLPGLGAPVGDLDNVFGPAKADSGVPGLVAYMFGSEPDPSLPGFVTRTEAKYVTGDSHVLAYSVMATVEEE